jgi:hypothetical protein
MEWEDEEGRVRHCRSCQKNVYNISMMSRSEAEQLLGRYEGELCVRFARREDGTLITGDCPIGKRETAKTRGIFAVILATLLFVIPSLMARAFRRMTVWTLRHIPAVATLEQTSVGQKTFAWLDAPEPQHFREFMGAAATQMNN